MKKSHAGFSLVEVLVFTTILGLFFVAALTITTFNLKNMKIQEHKILATRYAEEAIEWLKEEKENDWSDFITHTGTNYCLNSLAWTSGVCGTYSLGTPGFFKRDLLITNSGSPVDKVETTMTVSWEDMGTVLSVPIKTVFRILE
ncbi:MAG: type II secretion system protein [Patescibacteria group bacterium]